MCGELSVNDAAQENALEIAEVEALVQEERAASFLLAFLRPRGLPPGGDAQVEYRLACSGELYRKGVWTDWRRADASRVLLDGQIGLFVTSVPFHAYPQELCVRFRVPLILSRSANATTIFRPDSRIVDELAVLLTLLCRRLIVPVAKTHERTEDKTGTGTWSADRPTPILDRRPVVYWNKRPASVITWGSGEQEVRLNDVPPLAVNAEALQQTLLGLAKSPDGSMVLRAARAYSTALELIENRPEIAYLLLIASAETLAGCALREWIPPQSDQLESHPALREALAGLPAEQVEKVIEACNRPNQWARRKFLKYLEDHVADELTKPDRVFPYLADPFVPRPHELRKALSLVYGRRSGATHGAAPFPPSALVGTSHELPVEVVHEWFGRDSGKREVPMPPVAWFERVLSVAHQRFAAKLAGVATPITTES